MLKDLTIHMILSKDKHYKSGFFPVVIMLRHNKRRSRIYTKFRFKESDWIAKTPKVARALEEIRRNLDLASDGIKGEFTFQKFKNIYNGGDPFNGSYLYDVTLQFISDKSGQFKPGTIDGYNYFKDTLLAYETKREVRLVAGSLSEVDILSFMNWMEKTGKGPTTVSMMIRRLKAVGEYGIDKGLFVNHIYHKFPAPKANTGTMPLTENEFELFKNYTCKSKAWQFGQDFFVFMVISGGMEVMNICLLKWKNVSKDYFHFVREKTAKSSRETNTVMIARTKYINYVIEKYGVPGSHEDYVFPFLQKGMTPVEINIRVKQTAQQITKNARKIGTALGFKTLPNCKRARPTYATLADSLGLNVQEIQRMMGHSKINQTQIYMKNIPTKRVIEVSEKFGDKFG